jgi:hypothetical protein
MMHLDLALLALDDQYKDDDQHARLRSDLEAMLWSDEPSLGSVLAVGAAFVLAGLLWAVSSV